jgi:hypothetical protein
MANTNRTDVKIIASKEAVDFLYEKFENMNDGKYPNEKDTPHIADVFGAKAELYIDKIGSKWITIYDYTWLIAILNLRLVLNQHGIHHQTY